MDAVRKDGSDYLKELAAYLRGSAPLPCSQRFVIALHDAASQAESLCMEHVSQLSRCPQRVQALSTLSFAFAEIESNLNRISDLLDRQATS